MRKVLRGLVAALVAAPAILTSTAAQALDFAVVVHVTSVEVTYMPGRITFLVDGAAGSCSVGTWLQWVSSGSDSTLLAAQAQAVLSLLMTAKVSGQTVAIYGNNTGCTVTNLHLGSS